MSGVDFGNKLDLTNCDKEPIHIPGKIQSHGFLIACKPDSLEMIQISKNTEHFIGINYQELLNKNLSEILDEDKIKLLNECIQKKDLSVINPIRVIIKSNKKCFNMIANMPYDTLILELEPISSDEELAYSKFYYSLNSSITKIQNSQNLEQLFATTAQQVKNLIDYDRVMIYRFDKDWHGEVVAEAKNENLEPFLGLHYPHTDIPTQARELYLKNWIRIITDVNELPVEIVPTLNPINNQPLNLSNSILRATSPIHIEYLKNMGVCATLTISIILNDKLWGLFACHHYSPKFVDYHIRTTCEFIGKIFSSHLSFKEDYEDKKLSETFELNTDKLIAQMSEKWDLISGLSDENTNLLSVNEATGASIYYDDKLVTLGKAPNEEQIKEIISWLNTKPESFYCTEQLSLEFPEAQKFKADASGIIAICISKKFSEYVIWFKPEIIQTVTWAGNPNEKNLVEEPEHFRLSPRKSFEKWSQDVKGKSLPWKKSEINNAIRLKENITNVVVENSAIIKKLNKDLEFQKLALIDKNQELTNFAHIASHDLREPLRMVMNYNQLLLRRYKDKLDENAKDYINFSIEGVKRMDSLINDLLDFAKVGLDTNSFNPIDMNTVMENVLDNLKISIEEKDVSIKYEKLPIVGADPLLMSQLFQNLISNSIKYCDSKPEIEINYQENKDEWIFSIEDNGIGIEEKDFEKIFFMFKRLHSKSDYEGTGIGLSTCTKIVEAHKGRIWVESKIGKGSIFYFTISKEMNPES